MKLYDIIERATDFGTFRSHSNIFSFILKILFYMIPALILGHYTDRIVERVQEHKTLGENILYYILLQTLIIIITLYLFIKFLSHFSSEFQVTIECAYFITLYFNLQNNYINMMQEYLSAV
jgi:hypothetical protein